LVRLRHLHNTNGRGRKQSSNTRPWSTDNPPQSNPTWTGTQYSYFAAVMDAFAGYDNLAGFWVGNEVIRTAAGSRAAIYVKAATADMKAYRASKKYRNFMIGYSAADIAELRTQHLSLICVQIRFINN
jgi:hypothetical protein